MPPTAPVFTLVADGAALGAEAASLVARLVDAGVDRVQLRDRALEADALYAVACEIVSGARGASRPAQVVVNRRVDVAIAAGADGAHLGFDALSVSEARALMGADAVLGVSCHGFDEVAAAAEAGADYVHLAPIFDPISKPAERPALGLAPLREASAAGVPVIAQGGLEPDRLADVVAAGAAGIAVTGHVLGAADRVEKAAALRSALDR